jgi:hypothetical protein
MTPDRLRDLVRRHLDEGYRSEPGTLLYSGLDTLRPGDFYLMGLNPGGKPKEAPTPIIDTLSDRAGWSAYTMDCWNDGCGKPCACEHLDADGRLKPEFMRPHQKRVAALIELLDLAPERIFSTNAVFLRSEGANSPPGPDRSWQRCWRRCWNVHREFLGIVRPRWILCLGNGEALSAYRFIRNISTPLTESVPCGPHAYLNGKHFRARIDLSDPDAGRTDTLEVNVLGLPHPSRLPLSGAHEFVRRRVLGARA